MSRPVRDSGGRWCLPVDERRYDGEPVHSLRTLVRLDVPGSWDRRTVEEWVEWRRSHGEPVEG